MFVQDAAITVYIRQMPCGENGAVCVKQVWIQADNQNFTVVSSVPGQSGMMGFLQHLQNSLPHSNQ
jgi:hypothetical protein